MAYPDHASEGTNALVPHDAAAGTVPIAAIGLLLVRRIRALLVTALVFAVTIVVVLLIKGQHYTADSSFMVQGKVGRSGLSGIAAQFGLTVPTADASESPLFFLDLAHTRPILTAVADSAPSVLKGMTVETLFDVKKGSRAHRRIDALKAFDKALGGSVSAKTGIVELTLTTTDAAASANLLGLLVRTIDRFNRLSQQEQAGAQRRFTAERVKVTLDDLRTAEDRYESFQLRNRAAGSPNLMLDAARLMRDVQSAQALHSTLQQAMETARIEELRNTPVLTLLEAPDVPLDPDPRHMVRYGVVGGIFGGLVAALFLLLTGLDSVRNLSPEAARIEFGRAFRTVWKRRKTA